MRAATALQRSPIVCTAFLFGAWARALIMHGYGDVRYAGSYVTQVPQNPRAERPQCIIFFRCPVVPQLLCGFVGRKWVELRSGIVRVTHALMYSLCIVSNSLTVFGVRIHGRHVAFLQCGDTENALARVLDDRDDPTRKESLGFGRQSDSAFTWRSRCMRARGSPETSRKGSLTCGCI